MSQKSGPGKSCQILKSPKPRPKSFSSSSSSNHVHHWSRFGSLFPILIPYLDKPKLILKIPLQKRQTQRPHHLRHSYLLRFVHLQPLSRC
ncbi:hypothetical protein ZOSMA_78G00790 [Zostera marina]|uniref:Uncharacterized protein n=1 Tax=Zostera marina TaxID=29655 RepID=A0A0K9NNW5_ZOSMR|nr:hypothetical protein ZOSMA_78G00790 [Zostera marina]